MSQVRGLRGATRSRSLGNHVLVPVDDVDLVDKGRGRVKELAKPILNDLPRERGCDVSTPKHGTVTDKSPANQLAA